jgi:hypothetical protein
MQTMKISAVAIVLGTLMVSGVPARSHEIVNSTRDSILNTVRDDVYRRVQERVSARDLVNNPKSEALRQYQ